MTTPDIAQRITEYLASGGLFNPEFGHPDAVRDLLIDCREELAELRRQHDQRGGMLELTRMARDEAANELERLRAQNREVAWLIIDNDKAGAVKWAEGLATKLGDSVSVERLRAQVEPEGYKLVPVEPTPEMLAAAENAGVSDGEGLCYPFRMDEVGAAYVAMLAASPASPAQQAEPAKVQGLTDEQIVMDGLMMCPNRSLRDCAAAFEQGARWAERTCAAAWGVKLENGHD